MRKENSSGRYIGMKVENGDMLVNKDEVNRRRAGYFVGLLNVNDNRVATVTVVGNGRGMHRRERCDEEIGCDEISANVRKLKGVSQPV